jgi:hypothetical protein
MEIGRKERQFSLGGVRDEGKGYSVTTALKGIIEL